MRLDRLLVIAQCSEIFAHYSSLAPRSLPLDALLARKPARTMRIGFDDTGVYREAFTPDQPFIHAPLNRRLEHEPK